MDKNNMDEEGFYYTDLSDVVCCAFCVAQLALWQVGDGTFKEHQRWCPNCEFISGLSFGNISNSSSDQPTASSVQPSKSRDIYSYHLECRPNSHPEQCKYTCLFLFFFYVCSFYCPITNFQRSFLATRPRIYKHTVRRHDCLEWYPPLYARFIKQEERIQSFNKCLSPVNIRLNTSVKLTFSIQVSTFNIREFITGKKLYTSVKMVLSYRK